MATTNDILQEIANQLGAINFNLEGMDELLGRIARALEERNKVEDIKNGF